MNAAWEEGGDAQLASLHAILARCQRLSAPVLIAALSLLQGKQKTQKKIPKFTELLASECRSQLAHKNTD